MAPKSTCSLCKKEAGLSCSGCKDVPGPVYQETYYCSTACQKTDWNTHKKLCKGLQSRKLLYRAGDVLQDMFYMYRELLFDKLIVKVSTSGSKLYIYEGNYPTVIKSDIETLFKFPDHIISDPLDKKAILAHLACSDAIGYMHEPIKHMLRGISSRTEESTVYCKNPKREVIAVLHGCLDNRRRFQHQYLNVKLKNSGDSYMIDLAGAQNGYYDPITPYGDYHDQRVQTILLYNDSEFGSYRKKIENEMNEPTKIDTVPQVFAPGMVTNFDIASDIAYKASCRINCQASRAMMDGILLWERENGPLLAALKLPKKDFEKQKDGLLALVRQNVQDFLVTAWLPIEVTDRT